jgi:hypothetical protein
MKQRIVRNCNSEEEALLFKQILGHEGIDASFKGLNSKDGVFKSINRKTRYVSEHSYKQAMKLLTSFEDRQINPSLSMATCPNCGSTSLGASDMMKGHFMKMTGHYFGLLKTKIRNKKASYRICRSCELEFA